MTFKGKVEYLSIDKKVAKQTGQVYHILYVLEDKIVHKFFIFDDEIVKKLSTFYKNDPVELQLDVFQSGDSYRLKVTDVCVA